VSDEIPSGLDRLLGEMGVVDSLKAETEALRAEISALKAQLQHMEAVAAMETQRVAVAVETEREANAKRVDEQAEAFDRVPGFAVGVEGGRELTWAAGELRKLAASIRGRKP